ncbi:hypothetical protein HDU93_004162 [Gonapodya sp. JEL0774]|nr:hypothetical protein HDU93_004162 [Gonapodya sp. JEL0774]
MNSYVHMLWTQLKFDIKMKKADDIAVKAAIAESLKESSQVDPEELARQESLRSAGLVQDGLPAYSPLPYPPSARRPSAAPVYTP